MHDLAILVTGDRAYRHERMLFAVLDGLYTLAQIEVAERQRGCAQEPNVLLIQGDAKGADTMARDWAESRGVDHRDFPAKWELYGKAAGSMRNEEMLCFLRCTPARRKVIVAFHDDLAASRGTAHMVDIARKSGIPTFHLERLDKAEKA